MGSLTSMLELRSSALAIQLKIIFFSRCPCSFMLTSLCFFYIPLLPSTYLPPIIRLFIEIFWCISSGFFHPFIYCVPGMKVKLAPLYRHMWDIYFSFTDMNLRYINRYLQGGGLEIGNLKICNKSPLAK